jgi:hypothetical protein
LDEIGLAVYEEMSLKVKVMDAGQKVITDSKDTDRTDN